MIAGLCIHCGKPIWVCACVEAQHEHDIAALEAAIRRNSDALAAYLGTDAPDRNAFSSAWFRATVDLLRAHVRAGGNLLDALVHLLAQEHAAKARAMRDEYDALSINICVRCRQPLPPPQVLIPR